MDTAILPPDGGLTAWTQALMGHFVCFNTWGYISSFGVFETHYSSTLSLSSSAISWIGSIQTFLIFFVGVFSGRALDAGFFRLVFFLGAVLQLLGVFMTSLATSYWQLILAQGVCTGVGSGMMFCPSMGLVATYFSEHRVFVLAFCLLGSGTGGMIFPAIVRQSLPVLGFGWTVRVVGFVMLALTVPAMILFRVRVPPRTSGALIEWSAFKEPAYSLFCLGMFLNFWALYFGFFYIGTFGRQVIGLSYEDSVDLIIINNGVGIVGRLVPAYLANRSFGPLNTIIPLTLATSTISYSWIAVKSTTGVYVFIILYGIFSNGIQGLWPSTLSSLTTDISKTGVRMGMGFTVVSFACLTGPPLGGALVGIGQGYLPAQVWAGTCFLCGGLSLFLARISKTGLCVGQKV
ncbi:MFS general substrate transporter [Aureobasidium pullulans EXF-150]|uniref:MFS general substrate transporter n=1 Tax=Aureobasidium pullulans EXF-150 TaxID=1043002 RepID=A0A074X8M0_AURPU|nr:MFS general substrate transporter [Aureobasidium pullulans EXF-150]KEQ78397.1 MFS general substrate transporter [Aureobasidium pullulans EXF-150]